MSQSSQFQIQPVILCGGSGMRLWPLSRSAMPKPFLQLGTGSAHSLFQQTALRVQGPGLLPPLVICAESHRFYVLNQLAEIGIKPAALVLEPSARNTAAAVALAVEWAKTQAISAPLALLPADHDMGPPTEFQTTLKAATSLAQSHIVLFGINPTFANTDYGYIKLGSSAGQGAYKVEKFLEKPDRPTAETMLRAGNHVWNSGIFVASPSLLSSQIVTHAPVIHQAVNAAWATRRTDILAGISLIQPAPSFSQVPSQQFDTAVMEHTAHGVVMPYNGRWSDIGGFTALAQAIPQDEAGNSITKPEATQVLTPDTTGTYIHASVPGKVIAVHGLSDAVVVDTPDALLVTTKSRAAGVRAIFSQLQQGGATQTQNHQRVERPWGWYEVVCTSPGYLVKRIGVNPGGLLSLQYHHHRSEHWTVVTGTATVTKGPETFVLESDKSLYIPQGTHHRLQNATSEPLEIIEVQTGTILEESDIVRIEDIYKRA